MNAHPTFELVKPAGTKTPDVPEWPAMCPRQGIAAALIVNRFGREYVEPVIVVDFYRSAADANS